MIPNFKRIFLFSMVALLFVACGQQTAIVHDLAERDANEILVVLNRHNVTAQKEAVEKNQEVKWTVKVSPDAEQVARSILVANNLPRVRLGGLKGLCQDAGLILTERTEKCREILGYKEEIINLLESIACVVSADVVLNIPDKEEFPDENSIPERPTATASVKFLKNCQAGSQLTEDRVQDVVASMVGGMDPRDVSVVLSFLDAGLPSTGEESQGAETSGEEAPTKADCPEVAVAATDGGECPALVSVAGLSMDEDSAGKFKIISAVFLVLFLLIAAAFIYVLLRLSKVRKADGGAPAGGDDDDDQKLLEP